MNTKPTITRINLYRSGGAWCYAAWNEANEFDHSDPIGIPDGATEAEARAELASQFPGSDITRVSDVEGGGR